MKKNIVKDFVYWNRKLHIHLGLFLLFFIWLFSFSGLLLNHSDWKFASFWDERNEKKTSNFLTVPANLDSIAIVANIKNQLKIAGEISDVKLNKDSIDFRAEVPGHIKNIHVDFKKGLSTQTEIKFNAWGIIRTIHTFNGVKKNNPSEKSNWILTLVWRLTMDGIAIGLILLCLSSLVMWYRLKKGRLIGTTILILGCISAIYFVFLIRLL